MSSFKYDDFIVVLDVISRWPTCLCPLLSLPASCLLPLALSSAFSTSTSCFSPLPPPPLAPPSYPPLHPPPPPPPATPCFPTLLSPPIFYSHYAPSFPLHLVLLFRLLLHSPHPLLFIQLPLFYSPPPPLSSPPPSKPPCHPPPHPPLLCLLLPLSFLLHLPLLPLLRRSVSSRLMQVGEEFCGSKSEVLQESIKRQSVNYFKHYHR